jgi:hypothetical protein
MRAVIVVGAHHAGKSKTINEYLKPRLGIGRYQHKFSLNGDEGVAYSQSGEEAARRRGYVRSQSIEEAGLGKYVAGVVSKYLSYRRLVLAARPSEEQGSCLLRLKQELIAVGYTVKVVSVVSKQTKQ